MMRYCEERLGKCMSQEPIENQIRNTETLRHQAVRFFTENSNAALFLTATPIQLGSDDLYVLLNTLRPDFVIDKNVFYEVFTGAFNPRCCIDRVGNDRGISAFFIAYYSHY